MNIVFLEAAQNFGGARKTIIELAQRLKRKGINVLIVDLWGSCTPFVSEIQKQEINFLIVDKKDKPFIISNRNKLIMLKNYILYFFKWLSYRKSVSNIVRDYNAEVIIVNNAKTLSLLKKGNYKIVFFAQGWFNARAVGKIEKILIRRLADIYMAISQSTRQALFSGGYAEMNKIYVVPSAIDMNVVNRMKDDNKLWHHSKYDRPFVILHSGGFLKSKGQHIVVEIAKKLKEENINFRINMAGIIYKGDESKQFYDYIINKINEYGLTDYIEVILNQSDVLEYFSSSDVLIHPSDTEGLPRVVMEAMAFGKPVIGNGVGGMTDYILDHFTGYITQYNCIDDYAKAIKELISDKEKYRLVSENARRLILSSYTDTNQLESFNKILVDLKYE